MRIKKVTSLFLFALVFGVSSFGQELRFFRVAGPVTSVITRFTDDGLIVWTNAPTNTTFTIQTFSPPLLATNWVDYLQIASPNNFNTNRLVDYKPPSDMVFIPPGSFTMGNSFPGDAVETIELPTHTVNVSAFYMDKCEVTKAKWDNVYQWAITHGYSFNLAL